MNFSFYFQFNFYIKFVVGIILSASLLRKKTKQFKMIHKILVMDKDSGLGFDLYDDKTIKVDPSLLSGLVGALLLFTGTLSSDLDFRGADIGSLRITVSSKNGVQYIAFSDIFDNQELISKKLSNVMDFLGKEITIETLFDWSPSEEVEKHIKRILDTYQFPEELLPKTFSYIDKLLTYDGIEFETLLLTDLDDGIIHVYLGNEDKVMLLMEILSQLPIDRTWVGESSIFQLNNELAKEILLINRLNNTEFFILGQAVINPTQKEKTTEIFGEFCQKLETLLKNT